MYRASIFKAILIRTQYICAAGLVAKEPRYGRRNSPDELQAIPEP
jgi:hypothetical protein